MLMRACALTAQPSASRIGPRFRRRSLSAAMRTEGPEISSTRPSSPIGIQLPSPKNAWSSAPMAAEMPPTATPIAATVPTSIGFAAAASALSALAVASAADPTIADDSASAAAARFATRSSTMRTNFLYGDQNAWRRLMGLSTIFVMRAS